MRNLTGYILDDRFELIAPIDSGGTCDVYLAKDATNKLNKKWAVKCVDARGNTGYLEHYKQEVRILDELDHPNMTTIHYFSEKEGCFFFVMNYINGNNLDEVLKVNGPQSEKDVVSWMKTICDVLYYLHTAKVRPIIYCDLNPKNIMVDDRNTPFLLDYGISKEIDRGIPDKAPPLGTEGFAAPEQYNNGSHLLDERTDIYAVGATMYNILTAKIPAKGKKHVREYNEHVSSGLDFIIAKCLEEDPEKRYYDIKELLNDLNRLDKIHKKYVSQLKRRITQYSVFVLAFFIFFAGSIISFTALQSEKKMHYADYYNMAEKAEGDGDIGLAKTEYLNAIHTNPHKIEPYQKLYRMLSPKKDTANTLDDTISLCDTFRGNVQSKYLRSDCDLILNLARDALTINKTVYAKYSEELLKEAVKTKEYREQDSTRTVVDSMMAIAKNSSVTTPDMTAVKDAFLNLLDTTRKSEEFNATERMYNYYLLLTLLNNYPNELGADVKFNEISDEALALLDDNEEKGDFKFNQIIPLYEMIANRNYLDGINSDDESLKIACFSRSYKAFEKIAGVNLDVEGCVLKGNINRELQNYAGAKTAYHAALLQDPENRQALICMTQVCVDEQQQGAKDFTEAKQYYAKLVSLGTENISQTVLNQLNSLKIQMEALE